MNRHIHSLAVFLIALVTGVSTAHSATIMWTNASGGYWSTNSNWSPNQVPTNTDNVLITNRGTYTVTLDIPAAATNLTLGATGGAAGVQTFVVTNLLTVGSLAEVNGGGVLDASGIGAGLLGGAAVANGGVINLSANYSDFDFTVTSLTVTNGGMVSANGEPLYGGFDGEEPYYGDTIYGPVTVATGGMFEANGAIENVTVANGGTMIGAGSAGSVTVAHGGVLDVTNGFSMDGPLLNSGDVNLTNGAIDIVNNDYSGGTGGLVNLPGGLINLQGSGGVDARIALGFFGYITNQGIIIQDSGTNSLSVPAWFDNSQGTITNLSGTLTLGLFQTNLTGVYNAAAGATIQFLGADIDNDDVAPQLTLGTPLVLSGSGQYQLTSGYLYLPTNVPPNLELLGDTLQLGPAFQGGAITNLTLYGMGLLNALPITGTLTTTNTQIATNLMVANGGVFSFDGQGLLNGEVSVASGGVFDVVSSVDNPYTDILLNHGVTVAHGGVLNGEAGMFTVTALTNAGTFNLESPVVLGNGLINQAGGLINLLGGAGVTIGSPTNYFINQGTIVQNSGANTTNMIAYQGGATVAVSSNVFVGITVYLPFDFDTSAGTISNLSGTLVLPSFPSTLAGTFYAAAGTTIQLGGGSTNAPLVPGAPLVLGGAGQYQFISGYLFLPSNLIPNLSLIGGTLGLGAGFQGGAITNLTLDGIALTNQSSAALPLKGTFTIVNSGGSGSLNSLPPLYGWDGIYGNGVEGNFAVTGGSVLNVSNALLYGSVTVTNGGAVNIQGTTIDGAVMVGNGGVFSGGSTFMSTLTVTTGGVLNPAGQMFLQTPLLNAGTINVTNADIDMYNDGTTNYTGSLINQPGGLVNLFGQAVIGGFGGFDYVLNQGRVVGEGGPGFEVLNTDNATNSGTITVQTGQLVFAGPWTLQPSGSIDIVLNSATNYGNLFFALHSGPTGANAALAGTLDVTLNGGYVPTNGTSFSVLTYGSVTGSFGAVDLPSAVTWQSTFGATNLTLVAGGGKPQFQTFSRAGTNLVFNGTGGTAGTNYVILATTNLSLPFTNWTALTTNVFDGTGQFHYTNAVSPAKPQEFCQNSLEMSPR